MPVREGQNQLLSETLMLIVINSSYPWLLCTGEGGGKGGAPI